MGKIVLYLVLGVGAIGALMQPWVGVCLTYLFVILNPQHIWWWHFEGVRPVFFILLPTFIGFAIALIQKRLDFDIIKNKRNFFLATLWMFFVLSYFFSPYIGKPSPYWFHDPEWVFSLANKIFILYFVACLCINDEKKLRYLVIIFVISVAYLIYWANAQYLLLHRYGRIGGPAGPSGGSPLKDQNAFAMLFVVGLPFFYYMGWQFKKTIFRYALWLVIPFGWHAVFLTGSRGGVLGIGVTILVASLRSPRKIIGLILIPLFIVAFMWQAGPIMLERSATITQYEQEGSAQGRINAWKAATRMIISYPLFGVGLSAFGPAFPDFSDEKPREAHNTFFQIAAESGIIAGLMYVLVLWSSIKDLLRNSKILRGQDNQSELLIYLNEALLTSIIGFAVCAMFLSLQFYEIFYYLCVLTNSVSYCSMRVKIQSI